MKQIIRQENAIKILFNKKEQDFIKQIASLNINKEQILSNIVKLEKKIKDNPSPIQINEKIDIKLITNYHNFSMQINQSLDNFQKDLNLINSQLLATQKELSKFLEKKKVFLEYFDNLKRNKQYILDKKIEAEIQNQYNHIKDLF